MSADCTATAASFGSGSRRASHIRKIQDDDSELICLRYSATFGVYFYYYYYYYYYYLTAIGLTPVGSSTVHIYTQTVHRIQKTEHT
jgi:hypothetical protein